jgi:hypothetical protein
MKRNVAFNGGAAAAKVRPQQGDARIVMMQNAGVRLVIISLLGSWSHVLPACIPASA